MLKNSKDVNKSLLNVFVSLEFCEWNIENFVNQLSCGGKIRLLSFCSRLFIEVGGLQIISSDDFQLYPPASYLGLQLTQKFIGQAVQILLAITWLNS